MSLQMSRARERRAGEKVEAGMDLPARWKVGV